MIATTSKYVDIVSCNGTKAMAESVYQYDYGICLRIKNLSVSDIYEAQFGCRGGGETINSVTTTENDAIIAEIPNTLLEQSREIVCYLYHETENAGMTVLEVHIPVLPRLKPGEDISE